MPAKQHRGLSHSRRTRTNVRNRWRGEQAIRLGRMRDRSNFLRGHPSTKLEPGAFSGRQADVTIPEQGRVEDPSHRDAPSGPFHTFRQDAFRCGMSGGRSRIAGSAGAHRRSSAHSIWPFAGQHALGPAAPLHTNGFGSSRR